MVILLYRNNQGQCGHGASRIVQRSWLSLNTKGQEGTFVLDNSYQHVSTPLASTSGVNVSLSYPDQCGGVSPIQTIKTKQQKNFKEENGLDLDSTHSFLPDGWGCPELWQRVTESLNQKPSSWKGPVRTIQSNFLLLTGPPKAKPYD